MIPKRSRPAGGIFYGWWIVFGLALVSAAMTGMGGVNLGLFVAPMEEDLGFGQSLFGLAQTARLVGFSVTGWLVGRYLDRFGARLPLIVAGLIMGLSVAAVSLIDAGWQMVLLFLIGGMTGLQGQGANLYSTVPISRWFHRMRGRAFSITFLGIPVGIFILSPVTQFLIDNVGWRDAWLILAVLGTIVTLLVAVLIIRRQPEDMGLLPDGAAEPEVKHEGERTASSAAPSAASTVPARPGEERSWTREEAVRSPVFWRIALVDGLRMGAMGTLGLFRIPYLIEQGVSAQAVAFALSCEAVVAALAGLAAGSLVDRYPARFVSAISTIAMILTFALTVGADTTLEAFVAASMFGVGAQGFAVSQGTLWPQYFGAENIGKIRGFALPLGLSLSAVSAPLTGLVKDSTGSFIIPWIVACIGLVVCTVLLLATPKPVHPAAASSADNRADAEAVSPERGS